MKLEVWVSGSYDQDTKKRVSWRYVIGTTSALGTKMEIARVECRNKEPEDCKKEYQMALEICRRWNLVEDSDPEKQDQKFPNIKKFITGAGIFFLILTIGGIGYANELSNVHAKTQKIKEGRASWYSSKDACGPKTNNLKGCPTASGISIYKLEREGVLFCAVRKGSYRLHSRLRITNIHNGKRIEVQVLDRGGFAKYKRAIDLGKEAFARLAPLESGIINVKIEEIK